MLYIFDKDGTICQSKFGAKFINSADDQELIPGVAAHCAELRAKGHTLAVASNQGGVAFGIMSEAEAAEIVAHAAQLIHADAWNVCPHHPDGNNKFAIECNCRKPGPQMLLDLMEKLGYTPETTVFVGDRPEDEGAAKAAGVAFVWAKDFNVRLMVMRKNIEAINRQRLAEASQMLELTVGQIDTIKSQVKMIANDHNLTFVDCMFLFHPLLCVMKDEARKDEARNANKR